MSTGADDGAIETWCVRVRGRVQGVGYREACVRAARTLGVTGWVRNSADGAVEALIQGRPAALARMRDWLGRGPPMAVVDALTVAAVEPPGAVFDRFDRRATE